MKTLLLLRHGKSSWADDSLADFDRPLKKRGEQAAKRMGALLAEQGLAPDAIVASPALRARATADLAREAGGFACAVEHDERIYAASAGLLLEVARELPDQASVALLVGHNPGFEQLVALLTGARETMPTAALAIIDGAIESWSDANPACAALRDLWTPRDLPKE